MKKRAQPTDLELQVLGVLWERGPLTARQVMEGLPDGKRRAYTSVLSVMQVMEKKGLLGHTVEGKTHVYRSKVNQERILGSVVGRLVDLVFGGRPAAVVQTLLAEEGISEEELREMKRLIEERGRSEFRR